MQSPVLYQHAKDWDEIKEEYLLYNGDLFGKTSKSYTWCFKISAESWVYNSCGRLFSVFSIYLQSSGCFSNANQSDVCYSRNAGHLQSHISDQCRHHLKICVKVIPDIYYLARGYARWKEAFCIFSLNPQVFNTLSAETISYVVFMLSSHLFAIYRVIIRGCASVCYPLCNSQSFYVIQIPNMQITLEKKLSSSHWWNCYEIDSLCTVTYFWHALNHLACVNLWIHKFHPHLHNNVFGGNTRL